MSHAEERDLATRICMARCNLQHIADGLDGTTCDALLLVVDELERLELLAETEYGPVAPDELAELAPVVVQKKRAKKVVAK